MMVAICIMVAMLTFGWLILTRVENSKTLWQAYNHRVTAISDGMAQVQRHMGYGGFIHHFQAMVLHRDAATYQPLIERDLVALETEFDRLEAVLILPENQERLRTLRATFAEYRQHYRLALDMLAAGRSSLDIATATQVDDITALDALNQMIRRANQLTHEAEARVQQAQDEALSFMQIGGLLSLCFLVVATTVLLRQVHQLTLANALIRQHADQLRLAHQQAEAGHRAKSAFLAGVTHQLRTPMNAIIGFGQLLECDEELNPDQLDSVQEILQASTQLMDLINQLLAAAESDSALPALDTTRATGLPTPMAP